MSESRPTFVLVHGAWHNSATWNSLSPALEERGCNVIAVDLPGAGPNANNPVSYTQRPLDPAAFGTEPSPNAGVSQADRTAAVASAVTTAKDTGNGEVVLVGHSLGGLTISPVAEQMPADLKAVVYIAALFLGTGQTGGDQLGSEAMAEGQVTSLLMADPEAIGALRIDTAATDADYLATVRSCFYGDLSDEQVDAALEGLTHCDEPAQVLGVPSAITAANFGRVDRHYIRCANDRAIPAAAQDAMVADVDSSIGGTTAVHRMDVSHSPFHSATSELADILASIAR